MRPAARARFSHMEVVALLIALLLAAPLRAAEDDPARAALVHLLEELSRNPTREQAAAPNSEGKRLAAQAITGFLLALYPDVAGEHPEQAKRIERDVASFVRIGGGFGQKTWVLGFAAFWLAEKRLREDADEISVEADTRYARLFTEIIYEIEDGQNQREGGWGHGMKTPGSFYPTSLVAATNWCMLALGLSRRLGYEVDEDIVQAGLGFYERTQGKGGAFPYGGPSYRKGYEAGRTTCAVAALAALEAQDSEQFKKAAAYILSEPSAVPKGHASTAMHVLSGALAFRLLGDEAWASYDRAVLWRVRANAKADGTFTCLLESCPDCFEFMGGELNDLYISACYAAALAMPRSKVAALLRSPAPSPRNPGAAIAPMISRSWEIEAGHFAGLAYGRDRLLASDHGGRLLAYDPADGKRIFAGKPAEKSEKTVAWFAHASGKTLVWLRDRSADTENLPLSLADLFRGRAKETRALLVCRSPKDGGLLWQVEIAGVAAGIRVAGERIYVHLKTGSLKAFDLADGRLALEVRAAPPFVNSGLDVSSDGKIAVAAESDLRVFGADGRRIWGEKLTPRKGVNPPTHGGVLWLGNRLAVGRSDGSVTCYPKGGGKPVWTARTGGAVSAMAATRDAKGLLVLDHEGILNRYSAKDGSLTWSFAPPRNREHSQPPPPRVVDEGVLLESPGDRLIYLLDPESGEVLAGVKCPAGALLASGGGSLYLSAGDRIRAFDLR